MGMEGELRGTHCTLKLCHTPVQWRRGVRGSYLTLKHNATHVHIVA